MFAGSTFARRQVEIIVDSTVMYDISVQ